MPTLATNRKRRTDTEVPLEVPNLIVGDPTVQWTPKFGKIKSNGLWYRNCYKYPITLTIDGKSEAYIESYIEDRRDSGQPRGDYGRCHRYLVDGILIESKSVWFGAIDDRIFDRDTNIKPPLAIEVDIKAEDDDNVHLLSVKSGNLVDRKTYNDELEEFKEEVKEGQRLLEMTKSWLPSTTHPSISKLRKAARGFCSVLRPVDGVCRCGVLTTERRIKKRTSPHCGRTFFGCSMFPKGCGFFELADGFSRGRRTNAL